MPKGQCHHDQNGWNIRMHKPQNRGKRNITSHPDGTDQLKCQDIIHRVNLCPSSRVWMAQKKGDCSHKTIHPNHKGGLNVWAKGRRLVTHKPRSEFTRGRKGISRAGIKSVIFTSYTNPTEPVTQRRRTFCL